MRHSRRIPATQREILHHDCPGVIETARYLAGQLPLAKAATIANTAHLPNLERPEAFHRILSEGLAATA